MKQKSRDKTIRTQMLLLHGRYENLLGDPRCSCEMEAETSSLAFLKSELCM